MSRKPLPPLIRLYIRSCLTGFVLSAIFVVLLLWFDIMGLGGLIERSDRAFMAIAMLWFFNGAFFGSVQFAYEIMSMAGKPEDQSDSGLGGGGHRDAP